MSRSALPIQRVRIGVAMIRQVHASGVYRETALACGMAGGGPAEALRSAWTITLWCDQLGCLFYSAYDDIVNLVHVRDCGFASVLPLCRKEPEVGDVIYAMK